MDWNAKTNLTGAKTPQEFVAHIIDCVGASLVVKQSQLWMDVGTGSGLPGIVWSLFFPEQVFLLAEISKKRSAFLYRACSELGIGNIKILSQSMESLRQEKFLERKSDSLFLVSRGTFSPQILLSKAKSSDLPWRRWFIFSNQKIHSEYLTWSPSFEMKVELISYQVPGRSKKSEHFHILTCIEKV